MADEMKWAKPETEQFFYRVMVDTHSQAAADEVMRERLYHDEDYGFDYSVEFTREGDWHLWGHLAPPDTEAIDQLVDFVRTPEWSVSMLEDIADIVRKARPHDDLSEFGEGDDRAWGRH